jgi:hypothetical protein
MTAEFIIKISPDGREVFTLYNDQSPVRGLGKAELVRASTVEWDAEDQLWKIWTTDKDGVRVKLGAGFKDRSMALCYEVDRMSEFLKHEGYVEGKFERAGS